MDEQLFRKKTMRPDQLLGTQLEANAEGWCKHCQWAAIAHFIRASDGALLCQKDGEVFAVSAT